MVILLFFVFLNNLSAVFSYGLRCIYVKLSKVIVKQRTPKAPQNGQTVDSISLGQRIRHARAAQNLTLRDIAAQADVSYGTVQRLENGESSVQLDIVLRVLNVLNIDLKDFLPGKTGVQDRETLDDLVTRIRAEGKIPDLLSAIARQWPTVAKRSIKDGK